MNTMYRKRMQLSVFAVAALAIFAVAAVMLLAGGNQAQATTATPVPDSGGGNLLRLADDTITTHATPEPCPGKIGNTNDAAASVVSSGHIALFDVYWNTDEKELTNNPCPPTVTHVPAQESVPPGPGNPDGIPGTPSRDDRTASDINIEETVIHIPNSARVDLSTSTTYTKTDYPEVAYADDLENRSNGGSGDGIVWALPACPPDGLSTSSLCLSFSADLLNPADWGDLDPVVKGDGKVRFHIDHVHQLDTGGQGRRYVLAYGAPGDGASGPYAAVVDSSDAEHGAVEIRPGEYERPIWFFTRTGRYEIQMHVTGNPEPEPSGVRSAVSPDPAVPSDVREYIFHVGLMADLSVGVTAVPADSADMSLDPGDEVTITVTAGNAGPDTATNTKVDVTLPEGLTYSSHDPDTDTFADGDGDGIRTWIVGNLAKDASKTLTITATVDQQTRGEELSVSAKAYATEQFESEDVLELDPDTGNNMDDASMTVASIPNVDPIFYVAGSVPEDAAAGTNVGDPILVKDPDDGDLMTFNLIGDGKDNFTTTEVDDGVQIQVAQNADLDHETAESYSLTLEVRDGKDSHSNDNEDFDHYIGVEIEIVDVAEFTVTLSASDTSPTVGDTITFTVSIENSPVPVSELHYRWGEHDHPEGNAFSESGTGDPGTRSVTHDAAVTRDYQMAFWHLDANNHVVDEVQTNVVQVTWNDNN